MSRGTLSFAPSTGIRIPGLSPISCFLLGTISSAIRLLGGGFCLVIHYSADNQRADCSIGRCSQRCLLTIGSLGVRGTLLHCYRRPRRSSCTPEDTKMSLYFFTTRARSINHLPIGLPLRIRLLSPSFHVGGDLLSPHLLSDPSVSARRACTWVYYRHLAYEGVLNHHVRQRQWRTDSAGRDGVVPASAAEGGAGKSVSRRNFAHIADHVLVPVPEEMNIGDDQTTPSQFRLPWIAVSDRRSIDSVGFDIVSEAGLQDAEADRLERLATTNRLFMLLDL